MTTDWRALVLNLQSQAKLFEPATEAALAEAEREIGGLFPADLRALFSQTNGVLDEWGYGPIQPLSKLLGETRHWRSIDLTAEYDHPDVSLNTFVVIGTDAGGGPFGFNRDSGEDTVILHLDGEAGEFDTSTYRLEDYLSHYFESLSSFSE